MMKSLVLAVLCLLLTGAVAGANRNFYAAPPGSRSGESRLTVTARIYQGREDEQATPVAARFFLFKRSFVEILKSRNFQPVDDRDRIVSDEESYLEAFAELAVGSDDTFETDEETSLLALLLDDVVAANRVAVIRTDECGRSAAKSLPPGSYYLFGYASFDGEIYIWNLPVRVAGEENRLQIDQYNADAVISDRRLFYPTPYFNPGNSR